MVVDFSLVNLPSKSSVAVVRHDGANRLVDGNLREVHTESGDLGVEVGEAEQKRRQVSDRKEARRV